MSINIPKRQHRFLTGAASAEIFASTGCVVSLASADDPSDSVTVRGPAASLGEGLTKVMERASATSVETVDVAAVHRTGAVAGFDSFEHAKIILRYLVREGKLQQVQAANAGVEIFPPRQALVESSHTVVIDVVSSDPVVAKKVKDDVARLVGNLSPSCVSEIEIDHLIHSQVKTSKVKAMIDAHNVSLIFPAEVEERSVVLLIYAGAESALPADRKARESAISQALESVKAQLLDVASKASQIVSDSLAVSHKFYPAIVGHNGLTLASLIGEERLVSVKIPSRGEEEVITVRGPIEEVARVVAEIKRIAHEAEHENELNGHVVTFTIGANFSAHVVGKAGANLIKLREQLGVRVELDDAGKEGKRIPGGKATVTITGQQSAIEEAKKRIMSQVDKLADETSQSVKVAVEHHHRLIGQGGKYVIRLEEMYGVRILFPRDRSSGGDSTSVQKPDEVIVKGGKKGVESAVKELLEVGQPSSYLPAWAHH